MNETIRVFFALTDEEIKEREIVYKKTEEHQYKLVHTDLKALSDLIEKEFGNDQGDWYYLVLQINKKQIDETLSFDEENVVGVHLPIFIDVEERRNDIRKLPRSKKPTRSSKRPASSLW